MWRSLFPNRTAGVLFGAVLVIGLLFAWWTQHAWEDFWITFRSSKNLATGHGLVFTPGERLHTFTSPLGVLLPALTSLLTGNQSDVIALWLFRGLSLSALGAGAVFLWQTTLKWKWAVGAGAMTVTALILDGKTIDFSINGMETGLLIGFIGYAVWASFDAAPKAWRHLGIAWAGLMWSRPDAFMIIGLLTLGILIFNPPAAGARTRLAWIETTLRAAGLCTLLYLPWFLFAWTYYGTPIPHTITAKGGVHENINSWALLGERVSDLPALIWSGNSSLEGAFMPAYVQIGGWPETLVILGRCLAIAVALIWLVPGLPRIVRVTSFVFCGLHLYLSLVAFFAFPWYQPGPLVFAWLTMGGLVSAALQKFNNPVFRRGLLAVAAIGLSCEIWLTWQSARQLAWEQRLSANEVRRAIGERLHAQAQPGDTVFMEPLGHIGYFSGLKTLDFPGLSSREVTTAVDALGVNWATLIAYLSPDWVALRPFEQEKYHHPVLWAGYEVAEIFDRTAEISALDGLYGIPYLLHDAKFTLYRRITPRLEALDTTSPDLIDQIKWPTQKVGEETLWVVHAPGVWRFKVPAGSKSVKITFGFPEAAYTGEAITDGAEFEMILVKPGDSGSFFKIALFPASISEHRGIQYFTAGLPAGITGEEELVLQTLPSTTTTKDWTCWGLPEFSQDSL